MLSLVALLGGCPKNESETKSGGTSPATPDPLTGDWTSDACFGQAKKPAEVESCRTKLSFSDDLDFELEATTINLAAATENPGCQTTKRVTGEKWATDHKSNTLTISGDGHALMKREKCVNEKDNITSTAASDIAVQPGKYRYSIDGKTLTIDSGPLKGEYKQ